MISEVGKFKRNRASFSVTEKGQIYRSQNGILAQMGLRF